MDAISAVAPAVAKDAVSAVKEIVTAVNYLQEVHASKKTIHKKDLAELLRRILAIAPSPDTMWSWVTPSLGTILSFRAPDLGLLQKLKDAVLAAVKLVRKLTIPVGVGCFAWAKGVWNAKSNMQKLEKVMPRIEEAVRDLTLSSEEQDGEWWEVPLSTQGVFAPSALQSLFNNNE